MSHTPQDEQAAPVSVAGTPRPVGKVYLVGAGPGDPRLLTLRARDLLAAADVVLFDALLVPAVLDHVRPGAECVNVGKRAGAHSAPQEVICRDLVELGRQGKQVVRLKGGDPFIFGRGGEEALALAAAGIPFEVVPGVSAAQAVPAYAGIPLTHRGLASCVSLITGHEDPTKSESHVDWQALARGGGTLVFFMGIRTLERITAELLAGGRAPETPAAIVQWGTTPYQRTLTAPLGSLVERARTEQIEPPALVVVGEVVSLRGQMNWFETRALFGTRILITRSPTQITPFRARLEELGAEVLVHSAIEILPPSDEAPLRGALADLGRFRGVVFTSVNAVEAVWTRLEEAGRDARAFGGLELFAVGPATAAALRARGVRPDGIPARYLTGEIRGVIEARLAPLTGKRILLPRADIATAELPEAIAAAGGEPVSVDAYRVVDGSPLSPGILEEIEAGRVHAVTFTSGSTARGFFRDMDEETRGRLAARTCLASIGPVTSEALRALGLEPGLEAAEYTTEGLAAALVARFQR